MHQRLLILSFFVCQIALGQITSLNSGLQWFDKANRPAIDAFFQGSNYKLLDEKDSANLHILHYSPVKTETGVEPHTYLYLSDSAVEWISFETYNLNDYKTITSQLKALHFRSLGADVNGNFITTVYDNDRFLLNQDYEAVENPLGKGQLSYYRYRIYRKNGKFDEMNGEKTVMLSDNGTSYVGIRENYKNGVLSGERTFYYPNGTVKRRENYQAGRLNGLVSDYNPEGKLIHSVTHSYHWKYGMEKWFNNEGKVVKTLQWQRDLPVGTEKQTYNGTLIASIPYIKGVKQGLAKIPIYYDPYIEANYPLDTINDAPFAIETVNFKDGLKEGKAVCIYFASLTDTMYVANYKAGKLDSTFTRYGQNGVWYTTTFANDLENGTRIYRIPSGELKDTIYRVERYKNGKLDGKSEQFYRHDAPPIYSNPDPGYSLQGLGSHPVPVPEEWISEYSFETFKDGVRNGPFSFGQDSMNYNKGAYFNGKLDGKQESRLVFGNHWIKTVRYYDKNKRTGEWTTEYVFDSLVVTEHFENDEKSGTETKVLKGKLIEERNYSRGFLTKISTFNSTGSEKYEIVTNEVPNVFTLKYDKKSADTSITYHYSASVNDYLKSDTTLILLKTGIQSKNASPKLHGQFTITTSGYVITGSYQNGQIVDSTITYKQPKVLETTIFSKEGVAASRFTDDNQEPYTGIFVAVSSNETISVKDGLRNGWSIQYDSKNNEIRRTKYVKGVAKKTVEQKAL